MHLSPRAATIFERHRAVPGVNVHRIDMRRDPAPARDLRALATWVSVLRSVKPDVISVGTPKASLLGLFAGLLVRVPVRQYMVRGLRLEGSRGVKLGVLWAAEKATMMASTDPVAISPSLKKVLVKYRLVRSSNVSVIGAGSSNGVDLSDSTRSFTGLRTSQRSRRSTASRRSYPSWASSGVWLQIKEFMTSRLRCKR